MALLCCLARHLGGWIVEDFQKCAVGKFSRHTACLSRPVSLGGDKLVRRESRAANRLWRIHAAGSYNTCHLVRVGCLRCSSIDGAGTEAAAVSLSAHLGAVGPCFELVVGLVRSS
jgi:hypothetical protein